MENYKFETFKADSNSFDREFTDFLNRRSSESFEVQSCSYCHDDGAKTTYASCIFKRK